MFYHFHSYSLKLDFLDLAQVSNQGNWPSTRTLNKEKIILENRKATSRFSVSAEVMPFDGKRGVCSRFRSGACMGSSCIRLGKPHAGPYARTAHACATSENGLEALEGQPTRVMHQ